MRVETGRGTWMCAAGSRLSDAQCRGRPKHKDLLLCSVACVWRFLRQIYQNWLQEKISRVHFYCELWLQLYRLGLITIPSKEPSKLIPKSSFSYLVLFKPGRLRQVTLFAFQMHFAPFSTCCPSQGPACRDHSNRWSCPLSSSWVVASEMPTGRAAGQG